MAGHCKSSGADRAARGTAAAAATMLAGGAAVACFVSPARSTAGSVAAPSSQQTPMLRGVAPGSDSPTGFALPMAAVAPAAAAFAAALGAAGKRKSPKVSRAAAGPGTNGTASGMMSLAVPFAAVPKGLTNNPYDTSFPGDVGFDPLGFAGNGYIDEVFENFGIEFNSMRWYRQAELMHGRVAMLAVFNMVLRETPVAAGVLPDRLLEQSAIWQFTQIMAMLEGVRGWRLLVDKDKVASDLGLGSGQKATVETLAVKQHRELQNGRLAMLAFAGMAAQYVVTGRAVGVDTRELEKLEMMVGSAMLPDADPIRGYVLTVLGMVLAGDGLRRLMAPETSQGGNSIAAKAINPFRLCYGVQDPQVPLPAGVVAGQHGQRLELTEAQILQFEQDGVIMIKGACKEWVDFLRAITDFQIENPHIWSLIGRASGLYDYIQRNMWMTNNGFRDFLYYSPLGHCLAQVGRTEEIRVSTDMLLVNPNKGFGWHQDNQNGPIGFPDAMRWWCAMDRCGEKDYGAPEYLLGSHRNQSVSDDAVFVKLEDGDLSAFPNSTKFLPEPGDLIIWNARTIHRILAPPEQSWDEGVSRRAIGGTVAKGGTNYFNKGGASGISDLAGHTQKNGEKLNSAYFPRIYPSVVPEEAELRVENKLVGRSPKKIVDLGVTLASNAGKYISFTKVVGKKD
mmetsp:Transcript_30845/g.102721  ORF Transcript_30845/g.102721 Transcript_30845/m.102721 type:complete len:677 (-) Transcript_30845:331-2361(-)